MEPIALRKRPERFSVMQPQQRMKDQSIYGMLTLFVDMVKSTE